MDIVIRTYNFFSALLTNQVLMVPLAAHLAVLRSLVLPLSSRIEVKVTSELPTLLVTHLLSQLTPSSMPNGEPLLPIVAMAQLVELFPLMDPALISMVPLSQFLAIPDR